MQAAELTPGRPEANAGDFPAASLPLEDPVGAPPEEGALDDTAPIGRFCSRCGRVKAAAADLCETCARPPAPRFLPVEEDFESPFAAIFSLYVIYLLTMIIAANAQEKAEGLFGMVILDTLIVTVFAVLFRRSLLRGLRRLPRLTHLGGAALFGILTWMAAVLYQKGFQAIGVPSNGVFAWLDKLGLGFGSILLIFAVQPAVVEEIAFRGLILPALLTRMSVRDAIAVSALMFMSIHTMAFLSYPLLAGVGILLGILRVRSGSIYPCMVMHFIHNGLCLAGEKWMDL